MTEKEFRIKLAQKAIEYAKNNSSSNEEYDKLSKAFLAGANDYAWLTLEDMNISKDEYEEMHDLAQKIEISGFKEFFNF